MTTRSDVTGAVSSRSVRPRKRCATMRWTRYRSPRMKTTGYGAVRWTLKVRTLPWGLTTVPSGPKKKPLNSRRVDASPENFSTAWRGALRLQEYNFASLGLAHRKLETLLLVASPSMRLISVWSSKRHDQRNVHMYATCHETIARLPSNSRCIVLLRVTEIGARVATRRTLPVMRCISYDAKVCRTKSRSRSGYRTAAHGRGPGTAMSPGVVLRRASFVAIARSAGVSYSYARASSSGNARLRRRPQSRSIRAGRGRWTARRKRRTSK